MKVRHEINIINREITNADNYTDKVYVDASNYNGSCTWWFEIMGYYDSSSVNLSLRDSSNNIHASITITSGTIARYRVECSTALTTDTYEITCNIGANVVAARIIILQDTSTGELNNYETQIEIGDGVIDLFQTTMGPLTNAKTWYYDSSKWTGPLRMYGEIVWRCTNDMYWVTVELQRDQGTGTWINVQTIVYQGGSETVTRTRWMSFAQYTGNEYRIAVQTEAGKAGQGADIYNAKIIVTPQQVGSLGSADVDQAGTEENIAVYGDGTWVFVAAKNDGLHCYAYDGSGNLTWKDTDRQGTDYYRNVFCDGSFIYCGCDGGLRTYSVDGSGNLTYIDVDQQGSYQYIDIDKIGDYIVVCCNADGILSYTVDGSGFLTFVDELDAGATPLQVDCDSSFIYVSAWSGGTEVYSIDGSGILTREDADSSTDDYTKGVCSDANFVYCSKGYEGLESWSVDGGGLLTLVDQLPVPHAFGGNARGLATDGTTIFLCVYNYGVQIYKADGSGELRYIDGRWQGSGYYYDCFIQDGILFVAVGSDGLRTYTIRDTVVDVQDFESVMLLQNTGSAATGLQECNQYWDDDEWSGVTLTVLPEHDASSSSSNTKLQEDVDDTPSDVANSSITGTGRVRGGTGLSITDNEDIDTYVVVE